MSTSEIAAAQITIRPVQAEDSTEVAELAGDLGYPTSTREIEQRISALRDCRDSAVFVGCESDRVIGWVDVCVTRHLVSGAYAEIAGLIVHKDYRSAGVGSKLVEAAERWATQHGLERIVVRSRTSRERAHRFYLREGYALVKTSCVFSKQLG